METPEVVFDKFGNYERIVEDLRYFHIRCGLVKVCINSYMHINSKSVEDLDHENVIQELSEIFQSNLNFQCLIKFNGTDTHWMNFIIEIEDEIENRFIDISFSSTKEYFNDPTSN